MIATARLGLDVGGEQFEFAKRDAIEFAADVSHSCVYPGAEHCWVYLVMNYTRGGRPASHTAARLGSMSPTSLAADSLPRPCAARTTARSTDETASSGADRHLGGMPAQG